MTAHSFVYWPLGTALAKQVQAVMDVILHLGAHRTATTTFQNYLRNNELALLQRGVAVWEPRNTRKGLLHGVLPARSREKAFKRAQGRIALRLNALDQRGVKTLIVSDENVLGTMFANLKSKALYLDAGQRVAHFAHAFDGCLTRVVLSVRGQDRYWGSAIGYQVGRGRSVPNAAQLSEIVESNRAWRDVVTDVACAAGDADMMVTCFDRFAGRPEAHFEMMTGREGPKGSAREHLNATPDRTALREVLESGGRSAASVPKGQTRWNPFSDRQTAALSQAWHDDHQWLRSGADSIATYIEDTTRHEAGPTPPAADLTRGIDTDDRQDSRMAQTR